MKKNFYLKFHNLFYIAINFFEDFDENYTKKLIFKNLKNEIKETYFFIENFFDDLEIKISEFFKIEINFEKNENFGNLVNYKGGVHENLDFEKNKDFENMENNKGGPKDFSKGGVYENLENYENSKKKNLMDYIFLLDEKISEIENMAEFSKYKEYFYIYTSHLKIALIEFLIKKKNFLEKEIFFFSEKIYKKLILDLENFEKISEKKNISISKIKKIYDLFKNLNHKKKENEIDFKFLEISKKFFFSKISKLEIFKKYENFFFRWKNLENEILLSQKEFVEKEDEFKNLIEIGKKELKLRIENFLENEKKIFLVKKKIFEKNRNFIFYKKNLFLIFEFYEEFLEIEKELENLKINLDFFKNEINLEKEFSNFYFLKKK